MRRSLLVVLLSLGVVAPAVGATLGHDSARKPTVRLESTRPVQVVGVGFKSRESVKVTFAASHVWKKTVTATRAGRFDIVFPGAHPDRCQGFTLIARGESGSTASMKVMPMACAPILRDPVG